MALILSATTPPMRKSLFWRRRLRRHQRARLCSLTTPRPCTCGHPLGWPFCSRLVRLSGARSASGNKPPACGCASKASPLRDDGRLPGEVGYGCSGRIARKGGHQEACTGAGIPWHSDGQALRQGARGSVQEGVSPSGAAGNVRAASSGTRRVKGDAP